MLYRSLMSLRCLLNSSSVAIFESWFPPLVLAMVMVFDANLFVSILLKVAKIRSYKKTKFEGLTTMIYPTEFQIRARAVGEPVLM